MYKKLSYCLIIAAILLLVIYGLYAFVATNTKGDVNPIIAWGLPLVALVSLSSGIVILIKNGAAHKNADGSAPAPTREHKLVMYAVISAVIGTVTSVIFNAPAVFGIFGVTSVVLVLMSFGVSRSRSQESIQSVNSGIVKNISNSDNIEIVDGSHDTAMWFKLLKWVIIAIPILLVLMIILWIGGCMINSSSSSCQFAP